MNATPAARLGFGGLPRTRKAYIWRYMGHFRPFLAHFRPFLAQITGAPGQEDPRRAENHHKYVRFRHVSPFCEREIIRRTSLAA